MLFLPLLILTGTLGMENDYGREMFSRPFQSVDECYRTRDECNICYNQCQKAHRSFFSNPSSSPIDISTQLRKCRIEMSNQRTAMTTWCINDWNHFYATKEFRPTEKSCWMHQTDCAAIVIGAVKEKQEVGHPNIILAAKMAALGRVYQKRKRVRLWHVSQRNKYEKLETWFKKDALVEMKKHLKNPSRLDTQWSDPVYKNLTGVKKEVERINEILDQNNIQKAQAKNREAHLKYDRRMQVFLESIANLENHIISNKQVTNGYLKEIKQLVIKTYEAQLKASNLAYETTHVSKIDGQIILLDKELLEMFEDLRRERRTLSNFLAYSTGDKLKLVRGMRKMITAITLAQRDSGCPREELFVA